jgi:hypothetical protein
MAYSSGTLFFGSSGLCDVDHLFCVKVDVFESKVKQVRDFDTL